MRKLETTSSRRDGNQSVLAVGVCRFTNQIKARLTPRCSRLARKSAREPAIGADARSQTSLLRDSAHSRARWAGWPILTNTHRIDLFLTTTRLSTVTAGLAMTQSV